MTDLEPVAWLRRRIENRLALARHAIELGNAAEWTELSSGVLMTIAPDAPQDNWDGVHPLGDSSVTRLMEANDPQDTIARCEAELAILDEHAPDFIGEYGEPVAARCQRCITDRDPYPEMWKGDSHPCRAVALIARGYRYWEGWAHHWACPGCGVAIIDVPDGHSWAIPLTGGPWTCRDITPVSPAEFMSSGVKRGTKPT